MTEPGQYTGNPWEILNWDQLDDDSRSLMCKYADIGDRFPELWEELTETQKNTCLMYQTIPGTVSACWFDLSDFLKRQALRNQKIGSIVRQEWDQFSDKMQILAATSQDIPFLLAINWPGLIEEVRDAALHHQKLSPDFLLGNSDQWTYNNWRVILARQDLSFRMKDFMELLPESLYPDLLRHQNCSEVLDTFSALFKEKLSEDLKKTPELLRWEIVSHQDSADFISRHWDTLTCMERTKALTVQQIPETAINNWNILSAAERITVCKYQPITSFLLSIWNSLSSDEKFTAVYWQPLEYEPPELISRTLTAADKNMLSRKIRFPSAEEAVKRATVYAEKYHLEIDGEYLLAFRNHTPQKKGYRGCRSYRNGIYCQDWRCDPDPNAESSFGFGILPRGNTEVKVRMSDFCTEIPSSIRGAARVRGFMIENHNIRESV